VVSFDAAQPGTAAATWNAEPRMHDRPLLDLDGVDELIVVAAHPDDETLGAGGLIAECSRRGIPSRIVVVTDGGASGEPSIVDVRRNELHAAAAVLGASAMELGFPDGETLEHRAQVEDALRALLDAASQNTLIAAPWRGDGHRDHRIVGEVVASLVGARRFVEYPIWMWHWGEPGHPEVPWDRMRALPIDAATKAQALALYASQAGLLRDDFLENFARPWELFIGPPARLGAEYFDATYARHNDPWGFESRWYEERKRALTVAMLPEQRYGRALEIGCSIGVLTEQLAERCDDLLAVDVSAAAVERARARLGDRAQVGQADVLTAFPSGFFDLVVLSEVGYYFDPADFERVLDSIEVALGDAGTLLACHWRHPVADYPVGGDAVHEAIRRRLPSLATHTEDDFVLELFSRDTRSVARRTGLL
jgi:LmbE family N-acetylglucosaminyl deacetylase